MKQFKKESAKNTSEPEEEVVDEVITGTEEEKINQLTGLMARRI